MLAELSAGRGTTHPMAVAILKAQAINQALGGAAVMPWEVDELPDEWVDALGMFGVDLRKMERQRQEVERVKNKLKQKGKK